VAATAPGAVDFGSEPPTSRDESGGDALVTLAEQTASYTNSYSVRYSLAYDVLVLVNQHRATYGAPALTMSAALMDAAVLRAAEQTVLSSHTRPNGTDWYTANPQYMHAENIGWSTNPQPSFIVQKWMESPSHRAAILDPSYRSIAIGCVQTSTITYWTQEFCRYTSSQAARPADSTRSLTFNVTVTNGWKGGLYLAGGKVVGKRVSVNPGIYTIGTALSGSKAVDIEGASKNNEARAQLWNKNYSSAQYFRVSAVSGQDAQYTITSIGSGRVLDVRGAAMQQGTPVQQYANNGTTAQRWSFVLLNSGGYAIVPAAAPALSLDVSGGSSANGTKLVIWGNNNTNAQKFSLVVAPRNHPDGIYTISLASGNRVLDVNGGGTANGTNIHIWGPNSTDAQKFRFVYDSSTGYYALINPRSGRALDVAGAVAANETNVQIWDANGTFAQRWALVPDGSGYRIVSACGGLALDVQGGATAAGTNVWIYEQNGTSAQRWTPARVG
jgi:hypothetical protein